MALGQDFAAAQERVKELAKRPSNVGRAKYDAWVARRGTDKGTAMQAYVALVESLVKADGAGKRDRVPGARAAGGVPPRTSTLPSISMKEGPAGALPGSTRRPRSPARRGRHTTDHPLGAPQSQAEGIK